MCGMVGLEVFGWDKVREISGVSPPRGSAMARGGATVGRRPTPGGRFARAGQLGCFQAGMSGEWGKTLPMRPPGERVGRGPGSKLPRPLVCEFVRPTVAASSNRLALAPSELLLFAKLGVQFRPSQQGFANSFAHFNYGPKILAWIIRDIKADLARLWIHRHQTSVKQLVKICT